MAKHWKKYREATKLIDPLARYTLDDAVSLLPQVIYTKFTPSVEIAVKTNANPKYNDQMIRWTVVLPHGTGKDITIAAFVSDDIIDEAKKAWANIAGNELILKDIEAGNINFDILVTAPAMIRDLAKVAKILGPRWLMPSPKAWTVSQNITETINEIKKGRVEFKLDRTGNIHAIVGKWNFAADALKENITAFLNAIDANKPTWVKGKLIKKVTIAPTMGPGIALDM